MNKKKILIISCITVIIISVVAFLLLSNSKTYTVKFDSNGGSLVESQIIKKGDNILVPEDPTKEDSLFLGWYINDELYSFNNSVTKDITLTAKWMNNSDILFNGKYQSADGAIIKIYDFTDKRVGLEMTGLERGSSSNEVSTASREVNTKNQNGVITFKINDDTFSITRNKYDIVVETTDNENFSNGTYKRIGDYSMQEFSEEAFFGAILDNLKEDKYNAMYTRNDGGKLYMFNDDTFEEIVFISPDGKRKDVRLYLKYGENGESKLVSNSGVEYYRFTYNELNQEFIVVEYNGKGQKISNSLVSGSYTFKKYLDTSSIVNELQYLNLNESVIVDNN